MLGVLKLVSKWVCIAFTIILLGPPLYHFLVWILAGITLEPTVIRRLIASFMLGELALFLSVIFHASSK